MGPRRNAPFSGHLSVPSQVLKPYDAFFIVKRVSEVKESFHTVSPFLVEKALTGSVGEVASVRKLRSGDLLVEVASRQQSNKILKLKSMGTIKVTVTPHGSLNSSKGVISCGELFNVSLEEITKKLQSQGVTQVRRISIRRDGKLLNTKHLILTFNSPKLPESIKAGYMKLPVRPYVPNPLRCFNCQRFGHSKANCRGTLTCARCAVPGHESNECSAKEKCVNCKEDHASFSRLCPIWKREKEIISVKVKEQVSFPEARRIVRARTPALGTNYASVVKGPPKTVGIQYDTKDFKANSETDSSVTISESDQSSNVTPTIIKHTRKKHKSASEKSLALKLSKKGRSQRDLKKKISSLSVRSSVALGLATEGLAHKDLPTIFDKPTSLDHLSLHPSEEEDFTMSCDVPKTQSNVANDLSPDNIS
ncbi:uncharacterized protein LOC129956646 [Argiope bruennichi]|uniref:uncharacterized protein LOC129956646 n=1 Tax=Argiope bruennichi TaxID=94029 RepID=UPI0024948A20|nr:uncharacterized protein LOC129956646 [Argiope bruennichi]